MGLLTYTRIPPQKWSTAKYRTLKCILGCLRAYAKIDHNFRDAGSTFKITRCLHFPPRTLTHIPDTGPLGYLYTVESIGHPMVPVVRQSVRKIV